MDTPWNKWLPEFTGIKDICNCSLQHASIYTYIRIYTLFWNGDNIYYYYFFFCSFTHYIIIYLLLCSRLVDRSYRRACVCVHSYCSSIYTRRILCTHTRVRNRTQLQQRFQEVEMSKYFRIPTNRGKRTIKIALHLNNIRVTGGERPFMRRICRHRFV